MPLGWVVPLPTASGWPQVVLGRGGVWDVGCWGCVYRVASGAVTPVRGKVLREEVGCLGEGREG